MTKDDIIKMAVQCQLLNDDGYGNGIYGDSLVTFANLVAAAEREKTAKLFDNHNIWDEEVSILIKSQS